MQYMRVLALADEIEHQVNRFEKRLALDEKKGNELGQKRMHSMAKLVRMWETAVDNHPMKETLARNKKA